MDVYPENDGIVRATAFVTGWYIEEIAPNVCDVHFMIETDYKLPLWIQKSTAPKQTNYANDLKNYIYKTRVMEV